jgi:NADPH:quinone reductase-like Zn-dependent oxidoreductase
VLRVLELPEGALRVIADAAPADEGLVRALGADEVVARGDDVAGRIRKLAPNGVDGLADGAVLDHLALPAIADGGRLAVVRGWSGPADRDITVHPVVVANSAADTAALDRLARQAEDGTLTLRVARVLPAAEAAEAHRQLAAGGIRGRLVLDLATGLA